MDNLNFGKIQEVLDQNQNVSIAVGKNPNLDEMGAALAFYLTLKNSGKNVSIACPSDPLVEISSLVGIDKVKKNFEGGDSGDLIVSFPYKETTNEFGETESEIQKVSYTLENGFLNIVVKPGSMGLSFNEKEISFRRSGSSSSLLFVIGTATLSDLGNLFDPEALKNTKIINIDNKKDNQGFGEITLVSLNSSSVSELIASLIKTLNYNLDIDAAQNLLSGISFATNNFQDQKTSTLAFEIAAFLMKKGAVRKLMQEEKNFETDDFFFKPAEPKSLPQIEEEPYPNPSFSRNVQNTQRPQFKKQNQPYRKPMSSYQPAQNQSVSHLQPKPQYQTQPYTQPQPQPQPQNFPKKQNENKDDNNDAPSDWLTPKIYKGSTNIE